MDKKIVFKTSINFDESELTIIALSDGQQVGYLNVVNEDDFIWASSVLVYEGHRRQGIGSKMYEIAQKMLAKPFRPSEEQTSDAVEFWKHLSDILDIS